MALQEGYGDLIFGGPSRQALNLFDLGSLLSRSRTANEAVIRGSCASTYLGRGTALARILGRYKMLVDTGDFGLSSHLMLEGYWEMWVTEAICAKVTKGMVVADIGANLGYFSLLMADLVGPSGFVHAFEPNPMMAWRLRKSMEMNGFCDRSSVHDRALAARADDVVQLVVPAGEPKNAHLSAAADIGTATAVSVATRRLDSSPDWSAIEFAKIDVEGAEELVWAGAKGLLDKGKLRNVVLEFAADRYADPGTFIDALVAPGFTLKWIDPQSGIRPLSRDDLLARDGSEDVMLVLDR